jgi:hypothetical protein
MLYRSRIPSKTPKNVRMDPRRLGQPAYNRTLDGNLKMFFVLQMVFHKSYSLDRVPFSALVLEGWPRTLTRRIDDSLRIRVYMSRHQGAPHNQRRPGGIRSLSRRRPIELTRPKGLRDKPTRYGLPADRR